MLRITDIKLGLDQAINREKELSALKKAVLSILGIKESDLKGLTIQRKAVDARKKDLLHFVYSVDVNVDEKLEKALLEHNIRSVSSAKEWKYLIPQMGEKTLENPPVIVGFGPAGIFAALVLSLAGYKPLVIERGPDVDKRTKNVREFFQTGVLNEQGNILFGEGGAGTFSDGKLTTQINDDRCKFILEEMVAAGAPEEILYLSKPHVGTDILKDVIHKLRSQIIDFGGKVMFETMMTDLVIENKTLRGIIVNHDTEIKTSVCLLATGHSARDTYEMLFQKGVAMEQKPFSVGVRIEHLQAMVNKAQYGKFAGHKALGAADYKLSHHATTGRSAYTFCMCPGGYVVASASEPNRLATNGMSESHRDGTNANSALLVNVNPSDFGSDHPLAGIDFQRNLEAKAYQAGGGNNRAPVQLLIDFMKGKESASLGAVTPTYKPGYSFARLDLILPEYVVKTLRESLPVFDRKLAGFAFADAVLTGVETRSSSPVRISRKPELHSSVEGLYPIGEGSGYSGGIMSSAVDGMKTAERIISVYSNKNL